MAPAIALIVAPVIPADNNKPELRRTYLKAIKALRPNLKDHLKLLIKHKKLKRSSGTFGRKVHAINIPQLSSSYLLKIDINAINYRRFNGIYNAYGKKGHKEVDYYFRKTCEFYGKKGHNKTHYYTKKNIKKPKTPKNKAQIDTITEIPYNHLS
ncbi:hypothetical protein MKX08_000977 [Trichoderma sp. CBMAI-0020]|nr:hypothetical protein MKX08_000977 [Trichoderma sp. CBMAI-0020]